MDYTELDKIRKRLGWTKRELAKRIGVGERTIYGYYYNKSDIPEPISKLLKIYDNGGILPKEG